MTLGGESTGGDLMVARMTLGGEFTGGEMTLGGESSWCELAVRPRKVGLVQVPPFLPMNRC